MRGALQQLIHDAWVYSNIEPDEGCLSSGAVQPIGYPVADHASIISSRTSALIAAGDPSVPIDSLDKPFDMPGISDFTALVRQILMQRVAMLRDAQPLSSALVLGAPGLCMLSGLRRTPGSLSCLRPSIQVLITAFQQLHNRSPTLTTGARALSKHFHRAAGGAGFWGSLSGGDAKKNSLAVVKLWEILYAACWINIHCLPHEEVVLEVRRSDGYGARWSLGRTTPELRARLRDEAFSAALAALYKRPTTSSGDGSGGGEAEAVDVSAAFGGPAVLCVAAPLPARACGVCDVATLDVWSDKHPECGIDVLQDILATDADADAGAPPKTLPAEAGVSEGESGRAEAADSRKPCEAVGHMDEDSSPECSDPDGRLELVQLHGNTYFRGFLEPQMEGGHELGWKHD